MLAYEYEYEIYLKKIPIGSIFYVDRIYFSVIHKDKKDGGCYYVL
jgi:hypothetical protein